MADSIVGQVGPQFLRDGQNAKARLGYEGDLLVSNLHGKYADASRRGNLFVASNVAAQAVSVALNTTYTGLALTNPAGSGKNLSVLAVSYALTVAPAGIASLHLIGGFSAAGVVTHTTPLAAPGIQNCFIGAGANSVAKVDSAATVVNPAYIMPLEHGFTAAALPSSGTNWRNIDGLFTIQPGGWMAFGALTAVTGFGGFIWEEVDIVS
jgi:hypothetical protein